ncbi:MAG: HNH endonuclease [Acidimicrobiia bacterium]
MDTTPDPMERLVSRSDVIPTDLDTWEPGPFLGAVLSGIDRSRLSGHDLVMVIRAEAKMVAHFQAGLYASMSEIGTVLDDHEAASSEVGVALRLTRAAADAEHDLASQLSRFAQIRQALRSGVIDLRRARVLLEASVGLTSEQAARIIDRVLPDAIGLTTGQLRARVQRLRMESGPDQTRLQYQAALRDRRIVVEANPDGTANLLAFNLAPERVMAARRRLNRIAQAAGTPGDDRTADQRRADTLLDILTGRDPGHPHGAGVDIVVDLATLTGASQTPGRIPGWGPVTAEIARRVVSEQPDSRWTYTVTDQGRPVATGTIRRRPTTTMRRRVRSLHPTCVYPGCRMPAKESDLDHTDPWAAGGKTSLENLAPLCRHHHRIKDHGWTYRQTPDGDIIWTSPLDHTYTTNGQSP